MRRRTPSGRWDAESGTRPPAGRPDAVKGNQEIELLGRPTCAAPLQPGFSSMGLNLTIKNGYGGTEEFAVFAFSSRPNGDPRLHYE